MIRIMEYKSDALVIDKNPKMTIASQIQLNIRGEHEAIEGYYKLIPFLELHNDYNSIAEIEEIVAEEKRHTEMLKKISLKYDSILPEEDH